ncbi:type IV conjugative transfer system lipoprotein TraV [Marinobacter salicampi]|uniref:type IV conjugative transfer system lipoprotein TraV n=1 Tax=Marinobacter salicampi TaxID=435907 RepID=UPI00140B3255|nr:type IV conjugative transfer system lipoprotein TraV [Marinobacter salicampi]
MKKLRNIALVVGLSALTGCSAIGMGESEFSCSGIPEKRGCMSARDVYEATANGGSIYDRNYSSNVEQTEAVSDAGSVSQFRSKEERLSGKKADRNSDSSTRVERIVRKVEDRYVAPSTPNKPVPVRTPAQVMRVWIAPWEDKNANLKVSSYVFTEIEKRRWMYDMRGVARGESIQPLQMMQPDPQGQPDARPGQNRNAPSYENALPGGFSGNH